MTGRRVDGAEVDLADGHVWMCAGERFTGTAVDRFRDGTLLGETEYRAGVPDGLSRTYWPSGVVRREAWYDYGIKPRERTWYEDGSPQEDVVLDQDGVKHHYRYAEDGSMTKSYYRGSK